MSNRIKKLRKSIEVDKYPLGIEKSRLLTESFKTTEGEPLILRRAKALAHVLDNITIFIGDDELIVGNAASKPMGLEFDFYAGLWSQEEIDGLKQAGYDLKAEEEAEILRLNAYWKDYNPLSRMGRRFDDRLWPFMQSGMILPPWKNREEGSGGGYAESGMGLGPGFYLMTVDFEKVLNSGLKVILEEAQAELKKLRYENADAGEKTHFLKSVIVALEAIIRFAYRFADRADEMAAKEMDPNRKKELEKIAVTCRQVPANPARTFYEAIQSFWFIFLMITPSPTASIGRFDQYMFPFYKRDIATEGVTDTEVLELLQCLRIKDMHGPTAALNSAMKIDQTAYQAALLNMKFHPSSLKTTEDLRKLSSLIRTYFSRNGKHIQFNVVNRKTLRAAQKRPEKHKDLLVRIAGYSAHFIQLGKPMQEEIIKRTEHEKPE